MIELSFDNMKLAKAELAKNVEKELEKQIKSCDRGVLVLPGGNSIKPFYSVLAEMHINWSKVIISLCDERLVPNDSIFSNEKQLKEMFFSKISKYNYMPLNSHFTKLIDKIGFVSILGMGEDGHIASLFPNEMLYWRNCNSLLYKTFKQNTNRISLSNKAFDLSTSINILVAGRDRSDKYEDLKKDKIFWRHYKKIFQQAKIYRILVRQ